MKVEQSQFAAYLGVETDDKSPSLTARQILISSWLILFLVTERFGGHECFQLTLDGALLVAIPSEVT
jgi:hypothetical protein